MEFAMQAIVQSGYGAPERVLALREVDAPTIGDDDVLVRVRATSVNTPDWITVTGVPYVLRLRFGLRQPPSPVRGSDIAGVVESVGSNVTSLEPGDEVYGSAWADSLSGPGTFAELTMAPANQLTHKPANISFDEAGAAAMSGLSCAWREDRRIHHPHDRPGFAFHLPCIRHDREKVFSIRPPNHRRRPHGADGLSPPHPAPLPGHHSQRGGKASQ